MTDESFDNIQRWTPKRRTALVVQIRKGETSAQETARKHGPTVAEIEAWMEKGLSGMENQLRSRPRDDEALKDEEIKRLKQKVGALVLENDILREAAKPYRPTEGRMSEE